MKAIFRTLCGCEKVIDIPVEQGCSPPDAWLMGLLLSRINAVYDLSKEHHVTIPTRTFLLQGYSDNGMSEYLEAEPT